MFGRVWWGARHCCSAFVQVYMCAGLTRGNIFSAAAPSCSAMFSCRAREEGGRAAYMEFTEGATFDCSALRFLYGRGWRNSFVDLGGLSKSPYGVAIAHGGFTLPQVGACLRYVWHLHSAFAYYILGPRLWRGGCPAKPSAAMAVWLVVGYRQLVEGYGYDGCFFGVYV
jgi:hypothetical protein